jgi:uncharacterized protein YlxP (DUF503 family)
VTGFVSHAPVYIGVLRAVIVVPGSRTLKDRRRVVRSLVERLRSRFEVSVHEIGNSEHPGRQDVVVTTGGNERSLVEQCLRTVQGFLDTAPDSHTADLDIECFRWHPPWERAVSQYAEDGGDE